MDDTTLNALLSRKEVIEAALSRIEGWLLLFGIFVVVGVAGESVFGIRAWWNNRKLQALQHSIDTERASRAQQESESFRLSTEALKNENLQLQGDILKLREKMADRHLTPEQQKVVADKLRKFSGHILNVFAYPSDAEIIGIANDILAALGELPNGAGWLGHLFVGQENGRAVRGILIEVKPDADARSIEAAKALVSALASERLAVAGPIPRATGIGTMGSGYSDPKAQITITIGKKP